MSLKDNLTLEMIPDDGWYRELAEQIGVDNFLIVIEMLGGATTYIPKLDSILRPVLHEQIKSEFNGQNYFQLAQKYDISERYVRGICGPGKCEGQLSWFDENTG